jgi:hypothetical protein
MWTKPVFTANFRWLAAGLTREEKIIISVADPDLNPVRIHRIHMFLGLLEDPLVRGMDPDPHPDPFIINQNSKKILIPPVL